MCTRDGRSLQAAVSGRSRVQYSGACVWRRSLRSACACQEQSTTKPKATKPCRRFSVCMCAHFGAQFIVYCLIFVCCVYDSAIVLAPRFLWRTHPGHAGG